MFCFLIGVTKGLSILLIIGRDDEIINFGLVADLFYFYIISFIYIVLLIEPTLLLSLGLLCSSFSNQINNVTMYLEIFFLS